MEYKILEANGVENENIDGAALNNFTARGENGILKNVLNECVVFSSGLSVTVSTGELLIQGFRIKITDPYTVQASTSASELSFQIIGRITLSKDRTVLFDMETRQPTTLVQDNIWATESGVYEVEVASFKTGSSGVMEALRSIPVIGAPAEIVTRVAYAKATSTDGMHFTATTEKDAEGELEIKGYSVGTMLILVPQNSSSSLTPYLNVNGLGDLPIYIDAEGSEYIIPNSTGWIAANKPMLMLISITPSLGMHWSAVTNEVSSLYRDKQWFIDTFYSASRGGGNVYIQANGMVNAKQKTFNISGTIRLVGVTTTDPSYALITPAQLNTVLRNASTSETVKVKSAMGNWIGTLKDANLTQYGTKMFLNTTDGLKITRIHTTAGSMGAWSLSQIMNNVTGGIIMFTLFGEIE